MNVLSLFDGMSCGQIALERAGISVNKYYGSEIDRDAIFVARNNYPNMISLGDVNDVFYFSRNNSFGIKNGDSWLTHKINGNIELLIGGSPCQDISNLSKSREGLKGSKSSLFYQYLRLLNDINPKYFLLENVRGDKHSTLEITKSLGVRPLKLNSNLVSAQNRERLYWTNIPVNSVPKDKKIKLTDILEKDVDESYFLSGGRLNWLRGDSGINSTKKRFSAIDPLKAGCLTKRGEKSWNCNYVTDGGRLRKLTPIEWKRLQTVPDNYTSMVKDSSRYEMLGNGWTVDIITHILKHIECKQ